MQKGSGGDDDGRAVRMFDGGPVLHDGTDVHHVFPVLVDGAAQQADERLVGHDLLGDGVDEKAGVDERLAGTFALDGALGEFHEGLSARGLGANPPLDLAHQKKSVADRGLTQGRGQARPHAGGQLGAGLVPVTGPPNAH